MRIRIPPNISHAPQDLLGAAAPGPDDEWIRAILPRGARIVSAAASSLSAGDRLPDGLALVARSVGDAPEHRERLPLAARLARGLRLLRAALRVRNDASRVESRMRAAGLRTERVPVARPGDGQAIGLGRRGVSLALQTFVVGSGERRASSVVEEATERANQAMAAAAVVDRATVLAGGVVMVELAEGATRHLLRVAGPLAAVSAGEAAGLVERLLACEPPASVRDRLVAPIASGAIDEFSWWLEPKRPGRHPARVTAGLWDSCIGFLADLRSVPGLDEPAIAPILEGDADAVGRYLDGPARRSLAALGERLAGELSDLRPGWGHADFHPGNVLAEGRRLGTVLDWDAGGPAELPLLDLLHLLATSMRARRRLSHGERCTRQLWPLARAGGDARIASYCERTATPRDPDLLLALSQAYWLARVAGDVRRFGDRIANPEWLERNARRPLAELA